jgi:hypothetical protein
MICVAVLAVSAAGMSLAVKSFGVYLKKEPARLRKSLELLDENGLGHYSVISKYKIENPDVLKALGTQDYIQWILEDSTEKPDSAVRNCFLFVTYYGLPDRVPHVPEECYSGAGNQRIATDSLVFEIDFGDSKKKVPARYLVFAGTGSSVWTTGSKFPVMYVFSVNQQYAGSRDDVRIELAKNIFGRYSYFSKVEWNFFNTSYGSRFYPDKEDALQASKKLLSIILPILESQYWPDMHQIAKK